MIEELKDLKDFEHSDLLNPTAMFLSRYYHTTIRPPIMTLRTSCDHTVCSSLYHMDEVGGYSASSRHLHPSE